MLATMKRGTRTDLGSKDTKSIKDAADQLKVSTASVKRSRKVHTKGSEAVNAALDNGTLPVATAAALVDAIPDKKEQTKIVKTKSQKQIREIVKEKKRKPAPKPPVPKNITENNKSVDEFLSVWNRANATGKKAIWLWLVDNYGDKS